MPINQNIYPYNAQVNTLPVYLCGIGGSEYQYHIMRPEGYRDHQILFSASGKGILNFDSTTVNLAEDYWFFIPASYPHEYYPIEEKWDVRWVAFDGFACRNILEKLNMTKPFALRLNNSSSLQHIYNKMFTAQKTDKVYGDYTCSGLIYEYMLEFHRLVIDKNMSGGNDRSSILMPVLSFIDDNFRNDFPLTTLADIAGITPQHLCRIFRETMNMRPTEYLTKRRIEEAKFLLSKTNKPISEIYSLSGFSNPGYFSTVFKKFEGISPLEYRKKSDNVRMG